MDANRPADGSHPEKSGDETVLVEAINLSRDGAIIASRVMWAGTSPLRRRGLLGRERLEPDEGIYLVPCEWVHTFGMRFPIDLAFVARDGKVLAIQEGLRPRRLSRLVWRAEGVLELAEGRLAESGTREGDLIEFREFPGVPRP